MNVVVSDLELGNVPEKEKLGVGDRPVTVSSDVREKVIVSVFERDGAYDVLADDDGESVNDKVCVSVPVDVPSPLVSVSCV